MDFTPDQEQITNRHIAKLMSRLTPLNVPPIALSDIKREFWFLTEDIVNLGKQGERSGENTKT